MKYKMTLLLACCPIIPFTDRPEIEVIPISTNRIILRSKNSIINVRCESLPYCLCYVEAHSSDKRMAVIRFSPKRQKVVLVVTVDDFPFRERTIIIRVRSR